MTQYFDYSAPTRWMRRLVVFVVGLVLLGIMVVQPTATLTANGEESVPQDPATLIIHKFQQPNFPGETATGLQLDEEALAGLEPVSGVEFDITRVPDINVSTDQGRREARELSLTEAAQRTSAQQSTERGTTDGRGQLVLPGLPVGLYFVEELQTPAGVVPTDPFLVMLPMPHPTMDAWLSTVHVYPKNAPVDITLTVEDETAVETGDSIEWHVAARIPAVEALSRYAIENELAPGVELAGTLADITVELSTGSDIYREIDFEINVSDEQDGFTIDFTQTGLQKLGLARQQDPLAEVKIFYTAPAYQAGEHTNQVYLRVNDATAVTDAATTKFGPFQVIVQERNKPDHRIQDAVVALYRSPEDALADHNPIVIKGQDRWSTDANGTVVFDSLRFSNFGNGIDREPTDPSFRYYYLVPLEYPDSWTGNVTPQKVMVDSTEPTVLTLEVWRTTDAGPNPDNSEGLTSPSSTGHSADGPPVTGLASTGVQVLGLIILGVVIIAVGIVARTRRRSSGGMDVER